MPTPSIYGVGGSLIYLMEAGSESEVWNTDFVAPEPKPPGQNAGLLRVDHIAQTMHHEEMLSWLLYYVSLFDVAKAPLVQIAEPLGLVQSQAIESAEGGLRITLNGSTSPQTLSARFLQGFHGAGIQHIALATAEIPAGEDDIGSANHGPGGRFRDCNRRHQGQTFIREVCPNSVAKVDQ